MSFIVSTQPSDVYLALNYLDQFNDFSDEVLNVEQVIILQYQELM